MNERLAKILAQSDSIKEAEAAARAAAEQHQREVEARAREDKERSQTLETKRIRQKWAQAGILPLMEELASLFEKSRLQISDNFCEITWNHWQTGQPGCGGGCGHCYIRVTFESDFVDTQIEQRGFFGKSYKKVSVRNPHASSLNINGKIVGKDGSIDDLIAQAIAQPGVSEEHFDRDTL